MACNKWKIQRINWHELIVYLHFIFIRRSLLHAFLGGQNLIWRCPTFYGIVLCDRVIHGIVWYWVLVQTSMNTVEVVLSDWHDTAWTKSKKKSRCCRCSMYKSRRTLPKLTIMTRDQRERSRVAGCPSVTLREISYLCRSVQCWLSRWRWSWSWWWWCCPGQRLPRWRLGRST